MRHVVVVGAGVAGLTIARQLTSNGYAVTVLERDKAVGGLARSWHYGEFHFDVGPHRFHTENARVAAFIRDTLGTEVVEIPRKSGVRMFGGFHEWPLRPSVLLSMPFSLMLRGALDLVRKAQLPGDSFEADVINKYGRTLYAIFFEPYTRKFLFHGPPELHRDWARAGVNRAVIDKRAEADSLWSLLRNTLLPRAVDTTFLYPPSGVGRFSEKLAEAIEAAGGRVLLGRAVTGLDTEGDRVTAVRTVDSVFPCDGVIWTAPITLANQLLEVEGIRLGYLSTIFYNLSISRPAKLDFQWTYYGGDEIFSRVSTPVAFARTMAPEGKSGLCVELTCLEGDERWRDPSASVEAVIADLVRTGTIDHASHVEGVHIEKVPSTYPIYTLDYMAHLSRNLRELGRFQNLLLAGRTGRFWYNNMDHSIGQGLTMADRIVQGAALGQVEAADREFWNEPADQPAATAAVPRVEAIEPTTVSASDRRSSPVPELPAPPATPPAGWRWVLPAAAASLAAPVLGLAWTLGGGLGGVLYLLLYALALIPGLPVGFALFGSRHAAGWVAGSLVGYVFTALSLWAVIAAGAAGGFMFVTGWVVLSAVTWTAYLVGGRPAQVTLPTWRRQDTVGLLLVLLIVPLLLGPTLKNVGALDERGNERYRAYFTADLLWHMALTAELSQFEMPPKDPYAADQTLTYYWTYFMLPAAAHGVDPLGQWSQVQSILKVNRIGSGLLFIAMLSVFAWTVVPHARAVAAAVTLVVLASSAEGAYAIARAVIRGAPLDTLRHLNIDAITQWFFQGLTVDALPRSLWYTPQHAMACALGLVAIIVGGAARQPVRWPAVLLAGVALGAAMVCSPFIGGAFSLVYGLTVVIAAGSDWRDLPRRLALHATAAIPVALAFGWCQFNHAVDGAGAALHIGFSGPITRAPVLTPLLTLGPVLVPAAFGIWIGRRMGARLAPSLAGLAVGLTLFYFVTLPGGDVQWIGWRAGQILLVTMTPLMAQWFAAVFHAQPWRGLGLVLAGFLFLVGLPTTVIDTYNTQDISNRQISPGGFRWTVILSPGERRAMDWIRAHTSRTAVVQMEPTVRARETWTLIPAFAQRRMAAGLPISLLRKPHYAQRSDQMRTLYATMDSQLAWNIAADLRIDYLYVGRVERRAFGQSLEKFDRSPTLFRKVYSEDDVAIYEVVGSGEPATPN